MALAQARYGFLLRSIPVEMEGKFSATITAAAVVVFAADLYFGFETKVSWPGAACSMAATPVISVLGEALSRLVFRALAMSDSFMAVSGNCSGRRAWGCDGFLFRGEGRAVLGFDGRMRPSLRTPTARTALPALYRAGPLFGGGFGGPFRLTPSPPATG